jgi:hypothetical protein
MALDQGGIFRCELRHVSQCLDAEADPPSSPQVAAGLPFCAGSRFNLPDGHQA